MWHAPSHIIDCSIFLDVVSSPTILLSVWQIPQQMFFSTTPTFQGFSLWVISISWGFSKRFISTLGGEILLVHTSSRKARPRTLPVVLNS
jgi:hypothetical protein